MPLTVQVVTACKNCFELKKRVHLQYICKICVMEKRRVCVNTVYVIKENNDDWFSAGQNKDTKKS